MTTQLAPLFGGNGKRLAQFPVDSFDDAGHLRHHPVLGCLGLALGEQSVPAHLLLGRPQLALRLAQKILEALSRFACRRLD